MKSYEELIAQAITRHGRLCPGQVLGVRLAMLGCRLLSIDDPSSVVWHKKLIVYAEIDRCLMDALESVTGCSMGKRSLKFFDYGIMAATFCRLDNGRAFRVAAREDARRRAAVYAPDAPDGFHAQLAAYPLFSDGELFTVRPVRLTLPGVATTRPIAHRTYCAICGQMIRDGRETFENGEPVCIPCSGRAYFTPLRNNTHTEEAEKTVSDLG